MIGPYRKHSCGIMKTHYYDAKKRGITMMKTRLDGDAITSIEDIVRWNDGKTLRYDYLATKSL